MDDKYFNSLDPYGYDNSINLSNSTDPHRHYFYDEVNHLVLLVGWVTENITIKEESVEQTFWII